MDFSGSRSSINSSRIVPPRDVVMEQIWYDDITGFIKVEKLFEFWPCMTMSIEERINNATRFILYASLLLYITTRRSKYIVFGGLLIGMLSYVYKQSTSKGKGATDDIPPRT
jgi:Family of unknown function (DUF5762)